MTQQKRNRREEILQALAAMLKPVLDSVLQQLVGGQPEVSEAALYRFPSKRACSRDL